MNILQLFFHIMYSWKGYFLFSYFTLSRPYKRIEPTQVFRDPNTKKICQMHEDETICICLRVHLIRFLIIFEHFYEVARKYFENYVIKSLLLLQNADISRPKWRGKFDGRKWVDTSYGRYFEKKKIDQLDNLHIFSVF